MPIEPLDVKAINIQGLNGASVFFIKNLNLRFLMGLAPYVKKQSTIKIVILVKDPENIYSNEAERAD